MLLEVLGVHCVSVFADTERMHRLPSRHRAVGEPYRLSAATGTLPQLPEHGRHRCHGYGRTGCPGYDLHHRYIPQVYSKNTSPISIIILIFFLMLLVPNSQRLKSK